MSNSKIDPYDLNVPNVNFTLVDKDDDRFEKLKQERLNQGFDVSETWSLKSTMSKFIYPRLVEYQKQANDKLLRDQELIDKIDALIESFRLFNQLEDGKILLSDIEETYKVIDEGLKYFPEVFHSLWW